MNKVKPARITLKCKGCEIKCTLKINHYVYPVPSSGEPLGPGHVSGLPCPVAQKDEVKFVITKVKDGWR